MPEDGSNRTFAQRFPTADEIRAFAGNDLVYGRDGADLVRAGSGDDGVRAGDGGDLAYGLAALHHLDTAR
jgi:Ca2+-binding RTX toxin-like protein